MSYGAATCRLELGIALEFTEPRRPQIILGMSFEMSKFPGFSLVGRNQRASDSLILVISNSTPFAYLILEAHLELPLLKL